MHALVVYESMYGNTRRIAEAVARGLDQFGKVRIAPVSAAKEVDASAYDLVVVGGPTHRHGMSRGSTRRAADNVAGASAGELVMEAPPSDQGLREWLRSLSDVRRRAVSFDTRRDDPAFLTGRASTSIAKLLSVAGFELIAEPESFLVDGDSHLLPGEEERAQAWAASLGSSIRG